MIQSTTHVSDTDLELYTEGSMTVNQAAVVSEHLFECDSCNERYEQEWQFRAAMRDALPTIAQTPEARQPWWGIVSWPAPALAAAAALVVFGIVAPRFMQTGGPVFAELTAVRSNKTVNLPANRPIQLRLDARGADSLQNVRIRLVDGSNKTIWEGPGEWKDGVWHAAVSSKPREGVYWVRVLQPSNGEVIREYSLTLGEVKTSGE